jgi:hypothetical protein
MPGLFADKNDPDCGAILQAPRRGHERLLANPGADMLSDSDAVEKEDE